MQFRFSEDQKLFQEAFTSLLDDKCNASVVRGVWESQERTEGLWAAIAEMGALGIQVPEELGGLGFSEVEMTLLMEPAGYYALPEPFLEHAGVAASVLASNDKLADYLEGAISGEILITSGHPRSDYVGYGTWADMFLLPHKNELHLLPANKVKLHPQKSIETPRNPCRVEWKPSKNSLVAQGEIVELAFERASLAAAGMCLGIAQNLLDVTIEYVKERQQFGTPIGSQQAIKHHLADVAIAISHARPSVYVAAWFLADKTNEESKTALPAAKVLASQAADLAARKALQCQGAIGYTVENDLNFWLKKAWVTANSWGNADWHLERLSKELTS